MPGLSVPELCRRYSIVLTWSVVIADWCTCKNKTPNSKHIARFLAIAPFWEPDPSREESFGNVIRDSHTDRDTKHEYATKGPRLNL